MINAIKVYGTLYATVYLVMFLAVHLDLIRPKSIWMTVTIPVGAGLWALGWWAWDVLARKVFER